MKKNKNLTLVFLPGLGADARLFVRQQNAFKKIIIPQWLPPFQNESLAAYARRWAGELRLPQGCILVGISFGGMLALEMAPLVMPKCVLLIGSCRSPSSIPWVLKMVGRLPGWPALGKILARTLPFGRGWFLGVDRKEDLDLLMKMYLDAPNSFLQWTVRAILSWKGYAGKGTKIYHIHGTNDRLIPFRNVKPDAVVQGGGHTIVLSHPKEVNAFIKRCMGR